MLDDRLLSNYSGMIRTTVQLQVHDVCNCPINALILQITISSLVIGFKKLLFRANSLAKLLSDSLITAVRSSDFVITRMITDRIGLHSVLLPF